MYQYRPNRKATQDGIDEVEMWVMNDVGYE